MTIPSQADLRESIGRQAKRLGERLDLKLSQAQKVLAKALYRCSSWKDLTSRLDSPNIDKHIVMLASLPKSEDAKTYFETHFDRLSRSLSQQMLINGNLAGLYETMRCIFGIVEKPIELADIAPSIPISPWRSMDIGPDPCAVIWATTNINGVPIQLIGTRIYMPEYYKFKGEILTPLDFASPYVEPFKIIWSNPSAWHEAAHRYLSLPEDDEEEEIELLLPEEILDDAMKGHQEWLSRVAEMALTYGDHGEEFMPFVIPELGCYVVFGIPLTFPFDSGETTSSTLELSGDEDNDSSVILINGQPVCLEWVSVNPKTGKHDGRYPSYFNKLSASIFAHDCCNLSAYRSHGWSDSYFFIRPVTQFDIDQCIKVEIENEPGKEAIVLKTNHPDIASIVLDKIATREVMVFSSPFQESNFLMELDLSGRQDVNSFSLSLDAQGQDWWQGSNLVTSSIVETKGKQKTLYIRVEPKLLSLADSIQKKELIDAVQCGLVLHYPIGLIEKIEQPPKRCQGLKPAPKEVQELFQRPLLEDTDMSIYDLIRRSKRVPYTRDNF